MDFVGMIIEFGHQSLQMSNNSYNLFLKSKYYRKTVLDLCFWKHSVLAENEVSGYLIWTKQSC